ncbi:hypothetical protein I305_06122 [Cryptococcus gattii E566]|nr:hypothetical protein I305_06122 [Cryptococcus gattii E566]
MDGLYTSSPSRKFPKQTFYTTFINTQLHKQPSLTIMRWFDTLPFFLATVANASPIQRRQETSAATVPWATLVPASTEGALPPSTNAYPTSIAWATLAPAETQGSGKSAVPWSDILPGTPIVPASTLVPASPIPTKGSSLDLDLDPRKEAPAESVPWATLVPAQTKGVDESALPPPSTNAYPTSIAWATLAPAETKGSGESAIPWSTILPGTPIVSAATLVPAASNVPKVDGPKVDEPKPKVDGPKVDSPKKVFDPKKVDGPKVDGPKKVDVFQQ